MNLYDRLKDRALARLAPTGDNVDHLQSLLSQAADEIDRLQFRFEDADITAKRLGTKWLEAIGTLKLVDKSMTAAPDPDFVMLPMSAWKSICDTLRQHGHSRARSEAAAPQ